MTTDKSEDRARDGWLDAMCLLPGPLLVLYLVGAAIWQATHG